MLWKKRANLDLDFGSLTVALAFGLEPFLNDDSFLFLTSLPFLACSAEGADGAVSLSNLSPCNPVSSEALAVVSPSCSVVGCG